MTARPSCSGIDPVAAVIAGKDLAAELRRQVAADVAALTERGIRPCLAVVLVGDDPASRIYVRRKLEQTGEAGIASQEHRLEASCPQAELLELIGDLNADPLVHGILVQLPLPPQIDPAMVVTAIDPAKDVDGFHPLNAGRLAVGAPGLVPCTPLGCLRLLDSVVDDLTGTHAVIVGRSNIVGKPLAQLLLARGSTVTLAHSRTRNLPDLVRSADIVVAAVGRPALVRGSWVRPGAVVIDVGINRIEDPAGASRIVGDVAFDEMAHAFAVTPVPGGVGPMTIACLLANTVEAARQAAAR